MKKSPLCGSSAAWPENGPWRCHNKGPQQTLADFFLSEAVIHISTQLSKNVPHLPLTLLPIPSLSSKRNPVFGRSIRQKTKSSLSPVQICFFCFSPLPFTHFRLEGLKTSGLFQSLTCTDTKHCRETDSRQWTDTQTAPDRALPVSGCLLFTIADAFKRR